ncbi:MAG TPA: ABC transporter permease [Vicinamibacterales bacterium]|nr:ABC transporter permease [Vicinamibacterales bacterium]
MPRSRFVTCSPTSSDLGWTTKVLVQEMSTIDAGVSLDVPLDWRVLAFAAVATMISVALFGVEPAFRAARAAQHVQMAAHAKAGHRGSGAGPSHRLVIIQVALSLVMLVAAGLLVRTVWHLAAVPLGFDRDDVLLVTVETKRASTAAETRLALYERLVAAVSAVPDVAHAAASTSVPLSGGYGRLRARTPETPDANQMTLFNFVSPNWFATYGTPLVTGRDFDEHDLPTAAPVVIINEALARTLFAGRDPIGGRVITGAPNWPPQTVVGVVRDAVYHSDRAAAQSGAALRDPVVPTMYIPLAQAEGLRPPGATRITISVRSAAGSPPRLAASVGASLMSIDPNVSFSVRALADIVRAAFAQERLLAMLSSAFGALALVLAAIGVYGVTSYAVSQRRTEIGVRLALGATPRGVIRLILSRVAIVTGLGIIAGMVLGSWLLQVVSSFLFGVSADDRGTLIAAVLTVSAIGLAAGWLPAWRAARIEPVQVLREN